MGTSEPTVLYRLTVNFEQTSDAVEWWTAWPRRPPSAAAVGKTILNLGWRLVWPYV